MTDPHDPVDVALAGSAYLEDAGFTDGVLAALPPRRSRAREAVLLAAGVAAALLGALTLGETVTSLAAAFGVAGAAGVLALGTAAAAAAGALIQAGR